MENRTNQDPKKHPIFSAEDFLSIEKTHKSGQQPANPAAGKDQVSAKIDPGTFSQTESYQPQKNSHKNPAYEYSRTPLPFLP